MKLWRKELETVKASNAALLQENQRLREREQNTDSRINEAINHQQTSASQQQNELLSSLQTQIQQLKGNRTTDDSLAGLGIDEPEASSGEPLRWIAPADALPTDKNGRPLQPALAFPSTMQNTAPQPETPPPAAVKPVYTLPQNSTLIGSVAMTALLGRIPLNGSVTDPYPFKVLIGRDNLTANGIELPDIEGAVISGSATGDWTLSCVRGSLTSITLVFRDGTVRTLPPKAAKPEAARKAISAGCPTLTACPASPASANLTPPNISAHSFCWPDRPPPRRRWRTTRQPPPWRMAPSPPR